MINAYLYTVTVCSTVALFWLNAFILLFGKAPKDLLKAHHDLIRKNTSFPPMILPMYAEHLREISMFSHSPVSFCKQVATLSLKKSVLCSAVRLLHCHSKNSYVPSLGYTCIAEMSGLSNFAIQIQCWCFKTQSKSNHSPKIFLKCKVLVQLKSKIFLKMQPLHNKNAAFPFH